MGYFAPNLHFSSRVPLLNGGFGRESTAPAWERAKPLFFRLCLHVAKAPSGFPKYSLKNKKVIAMSVLAMTFLLF